jgi:hypothetical protein
VTVRWAVGTDRRANPGLDRDLLDGSALAIAGIVDEDADRAVRARDRREGATRHPFGDGCQAQPRVSKSYFRF